MLVKLQNVDGLTTTVGSVQGGHPPEKPGKFGEIGSGDGKVSENVFLPTLCYHVQHDTNTAES